MQLFKIIIIIFCYFIGEFSAIKSADLVEEFSEEKANVKVERAASRKDIFRRKRQVNQAEENLNCDFGDPNSEVIVERCGIIINANRLFLNPWTLGTGKSGNWIGGPIVDAANNENGGYAFASMSDLLENDRNDSAWLLTTPTRPTEARGRCLTFQHASAGLSVDSFGVYLFYYHDDAVRASDIDSTIEDVEDENENMNFTEPLRIVRYTIYPLIEIRDTTEGRWATVKLSISSSSVFSIAFKGKANHHYSLHRGYVAIDSITFQDGPCENDCSFDSDFCAWENPSDEEEDDFDWSLARSTIKRGTGPSRDQSSSMVYNLKTVLSSKLGGYAYINSGYPQKSGDKARLESPEIAATEIPLCMMFWVHMYGGGIGNLHVLRQIGNEDPVQLWEKRDTNGLDRWNPSQLTVTAPASQKYKVIFQADVGERGSGDIAIDTIAFREGPCPQLPPGSSDTYSRGDCTFLINTCDWRLQQPPTLTTSFTPMLKQISESYSTPPGKTQVPFTGEDYYMSFELGNYKHRVRDKAYLISPTIPNDINGICLSFWVYMYTNVPTETSVGALTVIAATSEMNKTIWRLENKQHSRWQYAQVVIKESTPFQIYIEGTKGTKRNGMMAVDDITFFQFNCKLLPEEAFTTSFDCSFDSDQCRWKVETEKSLSPSPEARDRWRYADYGLHLNVLMDHTYGIEKSGFMFIEALNDDVTSNLVSPTIEGDIDMCMSFFYASFFSDNTAELNVTSRNAEGETTYLWRITQAHLPPRPEGHLEVEWYYAQVAIKGPAQAVIVAKVRNGGWAIDDIKFTNDTCLIRPESAKIDTKEEEKKAK